MDSVEAMTVRVTLDASSVEELFVLTASTGVTISELVARLLRDEYQRTGPHPTMGTQ